MERHLQKSFKWIKTRLTSINCNDYLVRSSFLSCGESIEAEMSVQHNFYLELILFRSESKRSAVKIYKWHLYAWPFGNVVMSLANVVIVSTRLSTI